MMRREAFVKISPGVSASVEVDVGVLECPISIFLLLS